MAMVEVSAGLLLYRRGVSGLEMLLVHPGGPFWAKKDAGAWSIPKGLVDPGEDLASAARREFAEETGSVPSGALLPLGIFRQPSGKRLHAFAVEGDFDPDALASNSFSLTWPPKSGRLQEFPEVDRAGWFGLEQAGEKLLAGQRPILAALVSALGQSAPMVDQS
jgi:predicted NUDIX family NTP pyrophosphohydrolase